MFGQSEAVSIPSTHGTDCQREAGFGHFADKRKGYSVVVRFFEI
jgi:hypothetical protein